MKYCLSSRQTAEYLAKADEIKVEYRDRESIIDLSNKYPNKTIILDCHLIEDIDWDKILIYNQLCKDNFILCLSYIWQIKEACRLGLKRYLGYPIQSFDELDSMTSWFNIEYAILGPELFFNIQQVAKFDVKIRVIPNIAYNDQLPHKNGLTGTWIRPEDLNGVYSEVASAVEFGDCEKNRDREQALYRVYAEEKEWKGPLKLLITGLETEGVGRLIHEQTALARMSCQQKCKKKQFCKICERSFYLANPELVKRIQERIET